MARVARKFQIELTSEEKNVIDNILRQIYDIEDDISAETIESIFTDIYNSYHPNKEEVKKCWRGDVANIIIYRDDSDFVVESI